ncbi:MAG TPA: sensor histidine kinase [Actinomycetota bacterium]|nr:sensor histidine kinase [Actinomycetota bacterium]
MRTADRPGVELLERREAMADALLGAGLAVLLTVITAFASANQPDRRPFDLGTAALVVAAAGALAFRRRHPVPVLLWVFGATLLYFVLGYANGPIWLALIVAYTTAIVRGHRVAAWIAAAIGFAVFPWLDFVLRHAPPPSLGGLAALLAWLLVLMGAAEAVRLRRERAAEAIRIREEETRRRASEERLRIARELHDALGHHLSLINVQSGVALHLGQGLPEPARSSLVAIKQASKEALAELRSVLEILRQDDERAPRSPTSTLARLDDLVRRAAAAGLEVRTRTEGTPRPLPFGVDVAAFRIVQEALTNVARHAGAATATVRVAYGERDLLVEVDDDGRGPPAGSPVGGGTGIVGMRERAAALGGELEAGPRPEGGFRVRARFPLRPP